MIALPVFVCPLQYQNMDNDARVVGRISSQFGDILMYFISNTHPFNGPLSGTTQVSQYQKGKTNLDFTEARDSGW